MNGSLSAGADASGLAGPEIEVLGLAKTYAGGVEAVRGIDFQVGAGEAFGPGYPVLIAVVIAPALARTVAPVAGIDYMTYLAVGTAALVVPLSCMQAGLGVIVDRNSGAQPDLLAAATATMAAQLAITIIKIPAALLSGSAAQLNDAAEEVLDVIASAMVYLGVRFNAERLANVVVVALMAATGCLTLAVAVRRLFVPVTPAVSWYPLTVAAASVPVYAVRSAYERSAGLRGGKVSLVSQSVDSRNHALAGVAVTTGLISVILHAAVIDTLIGLALALTILKSCAGLTRDLIRSLRSGQQPGLSRYSLWAADRLEQVISSSTRFGGASSATPATAALS